MKKILYTAFVVLLSQFCNAQTLHEAPSLQVGLSGLNFSKGTLDAELIAEIIAEKQQEVKTKLVKNMLLKNIGFENGLFYTYIDNTINIITTEKDEKVRAKNLLENTVNLSFVIAYTDYYLRTLKPKTKALYDIRQLAFAYDIDTLTIRPGCSLFDITHINYNRQDKMFEASDDAIEQKRNEFAGVLLDIFAEVVRCNVSLKELGLMRTNYLQNAGSTNAYLNLPDSSAGEYEKQFAARIDQVTWERDGKEKRNTKKLSDTPEGRLILTQKKLDSMLTGKGIYKANLEKINLLIKDIRENRDSNAELQITKSDSAYIKALADANALLMKQLDSIPGEAKNVFLYNDNYSTVSFKSKQMDTLTFNETGIWPEDVHRKKSKTLETAFSAVFKYANVKYRFDLFKRLSNKRLLADRIFADASENLNLYIRYFGLVKTLASKGKDTAAVFNAMEHTFPNCGNPANLFKTIILTYDSAMISLRKVTTTGKEELEELAQVNRFLGKVKYVALNRFEYMAEYEEEIKPSLDRLGAYSTKFLVLRDSLFSYLSCIDSTAKADMHKMGLNLNTGFMAVFTRLDEFDKVPTYDLYLNLLSDAGDVFSNDKMRNSINKILTFVRSYVKVERDENKEITMRLDAEGFIYAIQKLNYNKFRPVEFLFTVGTNNASFHWNALYLSSGDSIKNYSYVSEKIGIKFKLWDYAYTRSFNRGETFRYYKYPWFPFLGSATYVRNAPASEPVVSNIHLLAYGSGLLYNIANTGTTKDFNRPMLGVGLGITFFNGLDMNFCVGRPVQKERGFFTGGNPTFINIGFDIQFVEYIDRLNKKRQNNQTQKQISEAITSQNKN